MPTDAQKLKKYWNEECYLNAKQKLNVIFSHYYGLTVRTPDKNQNSKYNSVIVDLDGKHSFKSMVDDFTETFEYFIDKAKSQSPSNSTKEQIETTAKKLRYARIESRAKSTFRKFLFEPLDFNKSSHFRKFVLNASRLPFFLNNHLIELDSFFTQKISDDKFKELIKHQSDFGKISEKIQDVLVTLNRYNSLITYSQNENKFKYYRIQIEKADNIVFIGENEMYNAKISTIGETILLDGECPESNKVLRIVIFKDSNDILTSNHLISLTIGMSNNHERGKSLIAKKSIFTKIKTKYIKAYQENRLNELQFDIEEDEDMTNDKLGLKEVKHLLNGFSYFLNNYDIVRLGKKDFNLLSSFISDENYKPDYEYFFDKLIHHAKDLKGAYESIEKKLKYSPTDLITAPFLNKYQQLTDILNSNSPLKERYHLQSTLLSSFSDIINSGTFIQLLQNYKENRKEMYISMTLDITHFDSLVYFESIDLFRRVFINDSSSNIRLIDPRIREKSKALKEVKFELTVIYNDACTLKFISEAIGNKSNIYALRKNDYLEKFVNFDRTIYCLFGDELLLEKSNNSDLLSLTVTANTTDIENATRNHNSIIKLARESVLDKYKAKNSIFFMELIDLMQSKQLKKLFSLYKFTKGDNTLMPLKFANLYFHLSKCSELKVTNASIVKNFKTHILKEIKDARKRYSILSSLTDETFKELLQILSQLDLIATIESVSLANDKELTKKLSSYIYTDKD